MMLDCDPASIPSPIFSFTFWSTRSKLDWAATSAW